MNNIMPNVKLNIGEKVFIVYESKRQFSNRNIVISGYVEKIIITAIIPGYNVEYCIKHEKCVNDANFDLSKIIFYSWAINETINPVFLDDNKVNGFKTVFTEKEKCIKWLKTKSLK